MKPSSLITTPLSLPSFGAMTKQNWKDPPSSLDPETIKVLDDLSNSVLLQEIKIVWNMVRKPRDHHGVQRKESYLNQTGTGKSVRSDQFWEASDQNWSPQPELPGFGLNWS